MTPSNFTEAACRALPIDQDRAEVRLRTAVLVLLFSAHMLEPAIYALSVGDSMLFKVVRMSWSPALTLSAFFSSAAMMAPLLFSLMFLPRLLHCRAPRQLACAGAAMAAVLWGYCGTLALPMDSGALPRIYWFRSAADLLVAGVFALSLNNQLIRSLLDESPATD